MQKIVIEVKEKVRRGEEPTQEDAVKVFEAVKEAFRKHPMNRKKNHRTTYSGRH